MTNLSLNSPRSETNTGLMNDELFGVFGDAQRFEAYRHMSDFDRIVSGQSVTIGLRGNDRRLHHRCSVYEHSDGCCVVWGELYPPDSVDSSPAQWVFEKYASSGVEALHELNGAYLVVVEYDGSAVIAPDLLRSIECYYVDDEGSRSFGTDPIGVSKCIGQPSIDHRALNQFLHFGVSFEERTLLDGLSRIPFDSYLTESTNQDLERFVYRPRDDPDTDYAAELAKRLARATGRRTPDDIPAGALASAGFDSRLLLAMVPDIDVSYTLGDASTPEVRVARQVATQYGIDHEVLPVTEQYFNVSPDIIRYTGGTRESLHIHHRGNLDTLSEPKMYHGLLLDTVLRDIYVPSRTIDGFGHSLPIGGLESNPDPTDHYRTRLGFFDNGDTPLAAGSPPGYSVDELFEDSIMSAIERCKTNCDSTLNAMAMLGIQLTPALPFRTQIADNHVESLLAADVEIIEWHLSTPPEYRTGKTFQRALELLDDEILKYRPPDRPHESYMMNQIEGFLRREVPGLHPLGTPWPDRDDIYESAGMDRKLFPDSPDVHRLPPRIKLRINDALVWLECATGTAYAPDDVLTLD